MLTIATILTILDCDCDSWFLTVLSLDSQLNSLNHQLKDPWLHTVDLQACGAQEDLSSSTLTETAIPTPMIPSPLTMAATEAPCAFNNLTTWLDLIVIKLKNESLRLETGIVDSAISVWVWDVHSLKPNTCFVSCYVNDLLLCGVLLLDKVCLTDWLTDWLTDGTWLDSLTLLNFWQDTSLPTCNFWISEFWIPEPE